MINSMPVASRGGQNGYSGVGQNQMLAGEDAIATLTTSIDKGGMRGIALIAMAIAEYELKKKAIDLAKDYYNTNKKDYEFFQSTHQSPIANSANEAFSSLNPTYAYDVHASVPAGIAKVNRIDQQWYLARQRIPKYNIGQQLRLDYDMAIARMHAVTAGWNAGIRYELAWTDTHNDRAFNRKASIVNVGIGFGNIVREGMANAVSNLATAYDAVGDTVASIGNGYAAYAGYNDSRSQIRTMMKGQENG